MPIAIPTPRFVLELMKIEYVYHFTRIDNIDSIVTSVDRRNGDWADCRLSLSSKSGWDSCGRYLFRDYSVLDFELSLSDRGTYTYFFMDEPGSWGLKKNLGISANIPALDQGWGTIRIRMIDLLEHYDGPIFCRPDDAALVIRGGYEGPGEVLRMAANH